MLNRIRRTRKGLLCREGEDLSLLLLLKLKIPVQLGLDIDDAIEELLNDVFSVGFECFVEFLESLFGFLVYGGLRAGGGALVLWLA